MYQEAVSLVQECKDRKIPLSKLRRSTLAVLHDFCLRESHMSGQVPKFSVSIEVIMIGLLLSFIKLFLKLFKFIFHYFIFCHLKLFMHVLYSKDRG